MSWPSPRAIASNCSIRPASRSARWPEWMSSMPPCPRASRDGSRSYTTASMPLMCSTRARARPPGPAPTMAMSMGTLRFTVLIDTLYCRSHCIHGRDMVGGMVVWERPEPPDRPVPAPLSRERLVRAAIQLADADGLDAVSLRKVAAALDVGPMRLYGYIATKEELLDLMVDAVYAEIRPAGDGWRQVLRSLAEATR